VIRRREGSSTTSGATAELDRPDASRAPDVTIVAHDVGSVGGMERVIAELVLGLRRLGHHVTVIARTCELPATAGIEFHRVRGPARPLLIAHPWFMLAGSLALRRWRRGIVQATGAIVVNEVDVIAVHYSHRVGPTTPSRSNPLFRAHAIAMQLVNRLAERWCYRPSSPATFVCVSEGVAEELRSRYRGLADRVLTIYNGVDSSAFAPGVRREDARALRSSLGIDERRLVAAFIGSEWGRKGLEPLIRALAHRREWDLIVAGGGDQSRYRVLAASVGVDESIHWLGVTSDVQLVYEVADAFVLPSSYETFSLVTFEAAASGLPILATPVNGVRELIRDGENGLLIDREPGTIAERLGRLADDPELRRRLGGAARDSALEFTWSRMVNEHHELYVNLDRSRRRRA
jgi:UDP-glucose:(heptosyl)LPS alpha-1,3-glucosyltransferase